MSLEEQFYETAAQRWTRELPWLRIFRAFRLAIDPRKLLLALAGLAIFIAARPLLETLPFSPTARGMSGADIPNWTDRFLSSPDAGAGTGNPISAATRYAGGHLLSPWSQAFRPLAAIVTPNLTWSDTAWAWTNLLWVLIVSAIFGGAISRIAALQVAGTGTPGLRNALAHSRSFFPSYLGGPLLSLLALGLFWMFGAIAGLFGLIPGVGPLLLGLFWFVPLLLGVVMSVILIGLALGWPLMFCTISVDGSDAFDAFSRTMNYLFSRGWYALFILVVTLLYGAALVLLLSLGADLAMHLASWSVMSGLGPERFQEHFRGGLVVETGSPTHLAGFWNSGLLLLLEAFKLSFFWSAATIAYFLLRHAEDATPFNRAYWITPRPANGPPLSGVAAAEHRELQRGPEQAAEKAPASPNAAEPAGE